MSPIYLAADWPVDIHQLPNLRQLHDLIQLLDGNFRILPDIAFGENKPFVDTLLVNISKSGCTQLMRQTGDLGFPSWQEVKPSLFQHHLAFDPFQKVSALEQRTWQGRLYMAYQHNLRFDKPIRFSHIPIIRYGNPPPSEMVWSEDAKAFEWSAALLPWVFNALRHGGITSIADLQVWLSSDEGKALRLARFGVTSVDEFIEEARASGCWPDPSE